MRSPWFLRDLGRWKNHLPPPALDTDTLQRLGFRCLEPTEFRLRDGSRVLVQADGWMLSDQTLPESEVEASCLRFYHVLYSRGGLENLDETDVMALVGKEVFLKKDAPQV